MPFNIETECGSLNATECILRAAASILNELERRNNDFNWDPPTFIITLAIGVIAAFFTGLTIVQGLLAAGPGRHKCSKYALGSWAQFSSRRLDWSELRYRSVAETPVITVRHFLKLALSERDGRRHDSTDPHPDMRNMRSNIPKVSKIKYCPKEPDEYFPASWLELLSECSLDHPKWWKRKPVGTDYIPSDLAAAPAYSSVNDLFMLVALASRPNNIEIIEGKELGLWSARSDNIEITFHPHARFGTYGIILVHRREQSVQTSKQTVKVGCNHQSQKENTIDFLLHAIGSIPRKMPFENTRNVPLGTLPLGLHTTNECQVESTRQYIDIMLQKCECFSSFIKTMEFGSDEPFYWQSWCKMLKGRSALPACLSAANLEAGGFGLLTAKVPIEPPLLFPGATSKLHKQLSGLLLLSRLWSLGTHYTACLEQSCPLHIPMDEKISLEQFLNFNANPSVFQKAFEFAQRANDCSQRNVGSRRFNNETLVRNILEEACKIDRWLEDNTQTATVVCRILSLTCTSSLCDKVLQNPARSAYECWSLSNSQSSDETGTINPYFEHQVMTGENNENRSEYSKYFSKLQEKTKELLRKIDRLKKQEENCDIIMSPNVRLWKGQSYATTSGQEVEGLPYIFGELHKLLNLWEIETIILKNPRPLLQRPRSYGRTFQTFGSPTPRFKYPCNLVQHPLDNLLIYRAILIAMLFTSATDNSDALAEDANWKTIPVL